MTEATNELSVTRFIAAKPDKVWDAMVNRQTEWWCPRPWRAEIDEQDRRPLGVCNMTFYGPDGEESPQDGIYLAYDEGKRFVTTDAFDAEFEPSGPFMIGIWEIEPEGEGTRYTATARHWSEETARQHEEMGFAEGWRTCADQLAEICEREA
ncbi:MAG TPA: SRPBCC domain-containing protein [Novosphingobium sp.]|nr:SRPBCC domain-containing protein [Novosphingobium sp.]